MLNFIYKRILFSLPLIFGITFISFLLIELAPGNFLDNLKLNPQISPQTIKIYERKFNLDKNFFIRYFSWLKNIFQGEFGYSFVYKTKVSKVIFSRVFNTFVLSLFSLILTWLLVVPLGIICSFKKNSFWDYFFCFFSYIGISTPSFLFAIFLLFLASRINFLPLGGMHSVNYELFSFGEKILDLFKHLFIPTITLSFLSTASLLRVMRSNLLEILGANFVLGAKARGLSNLRIFFVHVLKNALNPMITIFGYQLSSLLSGAALVEIVLSWPGLGQVTLEAVRAQDLYLVMASILIASVLLIIGNLIADILLRFFDPRIKLES